MTYRDLTYRELTAHELTRLYVCSQDGDVVADTEQHDAHHKYLQGYFRPNHDFDNESETEMEDEPDVARTLEFEHLKNRVEQQRIELEEQGKMHAQDVEQRKRMQRKLDAAQDIVQWTERAELRTDGSQKDRYVEHWIFVHEGPERWPTLDRLVIAYQELPEGKT